LKAEKKYDSEESIVGQMGNRHMAAVGVKLGLTVWAETIV